MRPLSGYRALFGACALLLIAPLWLVPYPPMIDLPQHAAQVYLLHHLDDPGAGYAQTYRINWLTPYYFGYGIAWLLSHAMPVTMALKLEISIALLGIPLALGAVLRESGGRPQWALLGFPIAYSSNYAFGFLNFMTATPLVVWALQPALRYAREPTRGRAVALGALSLFFFWCHALVAVIFGIAGCLLVAPRVLGARAAVVRCLPFAAAAPLAILWLVATRAAEVQTASDVSWRLATRAPDLLTSLVGGFRFNPPWLLAGLVLFLLPLATGGRPSRDLARWLPFSASLLLYLAIPHRVFGTAFVYMRFEIFTYVFFLLALDPTPAAPARRPARRVERWAIPVFVVAILLSHAVRVHNFGRESRSFDAILASMEPGQRVLALIFDRTSPYAHYSVYHHFVAWYQVAKGGDVEFSFAAFFPQMVRYRPGRESAITDELSWSPERFDWTTHCGDCYDYIVVRAPEDVGAILFRGAGRRIPLRTASSPWWLYETGAAARSGG